MLEVHLYGTLRRFAPDKRVAQDSVVALPVKVDDTIATVMWRMGIDARETSNLFLNGQLSLPDRRVRDGDRLGIFATNMGLLYI